MNPLLMMWILLKLQHQLAETSYWLSKMKLKTNCLHNEIQLARREGVPKAPLQPNSIEQWTHYTTKDIIELYDKFQVNCFSFSYPSP